jgi:hypothetical protein
MFEILSDEVVENITQRKQGRAQCQALDQMGIPYVLRPSGSPVVSKKAAEQIFGVKPEKENGEPIFFESKEFEFE